MVVRSKDRVSPWLVMRKPPLSMINAVVASVLASSSRNSSSSRWMSSSTSCGRVAMSCVLRSSLADELVEQHARNHVQRFEDAFALVGGGSEGGHLEIAVVEQKLHVLHRGHVRQIPLVVLQHIRNVGQVQLEGLQVLLKVVERLDVFRHFVVLRIGYEHDAVHAPEHELAGSGVNDLFLYCVALE